MAHPGAAPHTDPAPPATRQRKPREPRGPLLRQGRVGPPARQARPARPGQRVRRGARLVVALGAAVSGIAVMASCGGTSGENPVQAAMSTFTVGPERFSGEPPSPLGSLHSSALASVSSASASASRQAAEFEASANAQAAASRDKATQVLATVPDAGNALGDVTLTGIPTQVTGNLTAAKVTVTNSTLETRSYAIQVDFTDSSGQAVDSSVVGVENLAPNATANPVAFSTKSSDTTLIPVVVKAQRY
ncbi:hypothetical protein ACIQF6_18015 [Kitasatospora sp. NPDC092948]|uniref:hypothetical protein n=1 Tax=Kitasatospora sp. NPDC092948 TaxID=3364088 RepID=UPI00380D64BC